MNEYPRIRNLPEREQEPFNDWLTEEFRPVGDPSEPTSEYDWYYPDQYIKWKLEVWEPSMQVQ